MGDSCRRDADWFFGNKGRGSVTGKKFSVLPGTNFFFFSKIFTCYHCYQCYQKIHQLDRNNFQIYYKLICYQMVTNCTHTLASQQSRNLSSLINSPKIEISRIAVRKKSYFSKLCHEKKNVSDMKLAVSS